jgi:hypothetical protein
MRLLLLVWVCALLLPSCSTSSSCTLLACQSGAHFQSGIRFSGTGDQLTLDVCKNNVCARGTATGAPACAVSGVDLSATCGVSLGSGGNATLTVDIPAASLDDVKDGDVYRIRVTRASTNETLVDVTRTAAYRTSQPNGPGCDPTCKLADVS